MPVVQIPDFLKEVRYLVFTNHLGLLYRRSQYHLVQDLRDRPPNLNLEHDSVIIFR